MKFKIHCRAVIILHNKARRCDEKEPKYKRISVYFAPYALYVFVKSYLLLKKKNIVLFQLNFISVNGALPQKPNLLFNF